MKYSDKQLLDRYRELAKTDSIPDYLLIAVRSKADKFNEFDDKAYLFVKGKFAHLTTCTTNPGSNALLGGWRKYSKLGAAVIKFDEIYQDVYMKSDGKMVRHHQGKSLCLRQIKPMKYYRDGNDDRKTDESGPVYTGNFSTNFHLSSHNLFNKIITRFIGPWSAGCIVSNNATSYMALLAKIPERTPVTLAGFREF
jgi:hypothetical protein